MKWAAFGKRGRIYAPDQDFSVGLISESELYRFGAGKSKEGTVR
jgi:hypothetical protein